MFLIDSETYNDQEFAEAYAAGFFNLNRSRDKWIRKLTQEELRTEKENVIAVNKPYGNPNVIVLKYISENCEGHERTFVRKEGAELVSSHRFLFLAHNASGLDSWVVLNWLDTEMKVLKKFEVARGLVLLSFRCGIETVSSVEYLNTLNSDALDYNVRFFR